MRNFFRNSILGLLLLIPSITIADNYTYVQGPTLIESGSVIATAGGTTTLTVASNTNQELTGSSNQTVNLPSGTTLKNGRRFNFLNASTGTITIKNASGSTLLSLSPLSSSTFLLISNLTTAGTWYSGPQNATVVPIANGGTGFNDKLDAFNALSPCSSDGGMIYIDSFGNNNCLAAGSNGQQLVLSGGLPAWAPSPTPSGGAGVTFIYPNVQTFTSGTAQTYGDSYWFFVASSNATAGATYTNNSKTFTVVNTISAGTTLLVTSTGAPSASGTLTKSGGTGDSTITFTSFRAPLYIEVEMVGGGGGGTGSGTSGQGAGGDGGDTLFGSSFLIAGKGKGSASSTSGGGGGAASIASGAIGTAIPGTVGNSLPSVEAGGVFGTGSGSGGNAPYFSGAGASAYQAAGGSGISNTGGGGAGGGCGATTSCIPGSGGGSGGFVNAIISNPSSIYTYTIGSGGGGGTAGSSGFVGGAGGSGVVIVREYFE